MRRLIEKAPAKINLTLDVLGLRPDGYHMVAKRQAVLKRGGTFTSLGELREWSIAYYPRAHALLGSSTDADLARIVDMPWAAQIADYLGHPPGPTTLAETVLQVTSHSTYHRGQIATEFRNQKIDPVVSDFVYYKLKKS